MSYQLYSINKDGKEHLIVESSTYDGVKSVLNNSPLFFRNGYKIYEKNLIEENGN